MSLVMLKLSLCVLTLIQITSSQFMYDEEPIAGPIAASKCNYCMYNTLYIIIIIIIIIIHNRTSQGDWGAAAPPDSGKTTIFSGKS